MPSTAAKERARAETSSTAFAEEGQLVGSENLTRDDCSSAEPANHSALERQNFERITLTLWHMPEFETMTRGHRASIKCIRLNLEQEGETIDGVPAYPHYVADDCAFLKSMHDLFRILSTFKLEQKLRLEINILDPRTSLQKDGNKDKSPSTRTNETLERGPPEILGGILGLFRADGDEKKWWQTLPEAPAVRSLHLPVENKSRWRWTTIGYMMSRLPNLEAFHFDPGNEATPSQQIPEICAEQHAIWVQRLGRGGSGPSAIYYNPSFSGKTWAQALAYYYRVESHLSPLANLQPEVRAYLDAVQESGDQDVDL